MADEEWYWCLEHKTAVRADDPCPPKRKLGPYPSRRAAENWKQTLEARNAEWDAQDKAFPDDD